MTTFSELKKCKTLKELYLALGSNWFERVGAFLLLLWAWLPVGAVFCYLSVYLQKGAYYWRHGMLRYMDLFEFLGIVTLVYVIFWLIELKAAGATFRTIRREKPWLVLLLGLLFWSVLSTLQADDIKTAIGGDLYRFDGLESYIIYAAVMTLSLLVRDPARKKRVLRHFTLVADGITALLFAENYGWSLLGRIFPGKNAGVFFKLNHMGYYLTLSLICLVGLYLYDRNTKKAWEYVYLISFAFQFVGLLVNDTFGCYLAVMASLPVVAVFWLVSGRKRALRLFMPLLLAVTLSLLNSAGLLTDEKGHNVGQNMSQLTQDVQNIVEGNDEAGKAGTGRLRLWREALRMIPERPIFGYGPEGLLGEYTRKMGVDRPHNEYIQHAVFLGIPALLLYLAALLTLAVRQWIHLKELPPITLVAAGAAVAYLISACFGNTMFYTAPYFWMMLGFTSQTQAEPE